MLYMCAKLGQCGAIRGNVKQPHMSAYIGLTVTQTTSMTPLLRETNNGAYSGSGLSKQKARSLFLSPILPVFFLSHALSAANGYPDVSQSGEVICPFVIFCSEAFCMVQVQEDTHNPFHFPSIGRPLSLLKKQCSESHGKWI